MNQPPSPAQPTAQPQPEPLTARELEVLRLVALGSTNRDIAERLVVTERTVKFHVSAILAKLGARNRTEAVALGKQTGCTGHGFAGLTDSRIAFENPARCAHPWVAT